MNKSFRRLLALLIAVVMVVGLLPAAVFAETPKETDAAQPIRVFTEADNAILDNDVFAKINTVKAEAAAACGGVGHMTEADYIAAVPQVIEAIKSSETYVPGTLLQNGNFLVWETTVGMPCCYDPRMEAELRNTDNEPTPADIARAEARAQAILESAQPVRGGGPTATNIGLIQPYWESSSNYADSSFNNYSPQYKAMWQSLYETTGGQAIRYTMSNATVDNIASAMEQCGLVIFDSHGTTDYSNGNDYTSRANSSYLCLTTNTGVTSEDTAAQQGPYGTYYNCMKGSGYAYVNGTCIANHMSQNAPHSLLYMGICLGMATDGMEAPLRDKGVEVVHGYSQTVTFVGEAIYMNSILGYVKDGQSYGEAITQTKNETCWWDPHPSYTNYTEEQAANNRIAFPIVVSTEDQYPGHGNVDAIQNVYSTWSLFGTNFEVTASSNNEEWGTVEVIGSRIVAHPAEGYYTAGYELLSGTATVTQNGNSFMVQAETDCSVQINFAAKTPAVVSYFSNGILINSENSYVGDDVVLPTAAPEIDGYRFRGWVDAPVYETTEKPSYIKPNTSYTVTETAVNIYALYSCVYGGSGLCYKLVDEDQTDWEGNYVISGSKNNVVQVLKGLSAGSSYESNAAESVVPYTNAGIDLDEDVLREVADDYIWVVETYGSGYSIQNLGNETYMGTSGYTLNSNGSLNGNNTTWSFTYVSDKGTRAACAGGSYPYLTFYSNSNFGLWSESYFNQYPVQFWKETEDGVTYYCTEIAPHEHTLEHVEASDPSCTEDGNIEYWRCTICEKCFSDAEGQNEIPADSVVIPALNHDWSDWTETTPPSCTAAGEESRSCSRCPETETRPVEALGHDYQDVVTDPTCTEGGYTTHTCSRCPETETRPVEALGHAWDEGVVTVKPTDSKDGECLYTCTRCNETKTEVLPKLDRENPFVDVLLGSYYYDQVLWAYYHEPQITKGTDDTHFSPDAGCTRAQVATFLYAAAGKPAFEMPDASFTDVAEGDWYYKPVMWALSQGITAGMGDGSFGANVTCTRAQIVTFLYAAAHKPAFEMPDASFTDVTEGDWFYKPVMWALSNKVTAGMGDGSFGANSTCTRAQIVTFLYKVYGVNE